MNPIITKLALDAGLEDIFQDGSHWQSGGARSVAGGRLEAFARAVAERAAQICEAGIANAADWDSSYWDQACAGRASAIRKEFGLPAGAGEDGG